VENDTTNACRYFVLISVQKQLFKTVRTAMLLYIVKILFQF